MLIRSPTIIYSTAIIYSNAVTTGHVVYNLLLLLSKQTGRSVYIINNRVIPPLLYNASMC